MPHYLTILGPLGLLIVLIGTIWSAVRVFRDGIRQENKLAGWFAQRDLIALGLFAVATVVMTYPLALRLGKALTSGGDLFTAYWQIWWLGQVLQGGSDPNFAPLLFHPQGLDVTFQPRRWAAMGVWLPLSALFGQIAGFNISALLGIFTSACTAYLLVRELTGTRVAAWLGGAFFTFYSQHLIDALGQPNTGSTQWMPLFLFALVLALRRLDDPAYPDHRLTRDSLAAILLAVFALSLNIYVSIKPWLQAGMIGLLYAGLTALVRGWWRRGAFWQAMGVIAVLSLILALPVLLPLTSAGIKGAIEQKPVTDGVDLLAFVKPAPNQMPFVPNGIAQLLGRERTSWVGGSFHVGVITIAIVLLGLIDLVSRQRHRLVWLVIAILFASLSLGVVLQIDGQVYENIWTPYKSLQNNLFFQILRKPHRLAHGFSLVWAVLFGFGVAYGWRLLSNLGLLASAALVMVSLTMLYEISIVPIITSPVNVSPFYTEVLPEAEAGAIIDLPMGRQSAKSYLFLQTIHERPIAEGVVARMPPGAYDYVLENPLLRAFSESDRQPCDFIYPEAINSLQRDGYRYVIVHVEQDWMIHYFDTVIPIYMDDLITVYTLDDMKRHLPCG